MSVSTLIKGMRTRDVVENRVYILVQTYCDIWQGSPHVSWPSAAVALHPPRVCPGIFIVIRFDPVFFTFIMKRVVRFMGVMDRIPGIWGVGLGGLAAR